MGVFAPVFSRPVWPQVQVLLTGAVLAPGQRTVTALRRLMGRRAAPNLPTSHRVLHRAVWAPRHACRRLLRRFVAVCVPSGGGLCGLDATIERRWGAHLTAPGISRDPGRSSQAPVVQASGRRWRGWRLRTPMAGANRVWALPLLTGRCPAEPLLGPARAPPAPRAGTRL